MLPRRPFWGNDKRGERVALRHAKVRAARAWEPGACHRYIRIAPSAPQRYDVTGENPYGFIGRRRFVGDLSMSDVPDLRLSLANVAPVRLGGEFVLYWMTAARRVTWNFALQRAVELARDIAKPLVILEELRLAPRWDSDRLHRFALEGMADTARRLKGRAVTYYPYGEPQAGGAALR